MDSSPAYHAAVMATECWRMSTAVAHGHVLLPAENSTYNELYGMLVALEQFIRSREPDELLALKEVQIINDNQASIDQARTGSGHHTAVCEAMHYIAGAHDIKLLFKWLPRTSELMVQADHLTRHEDPSDWLLDRTALTDTVSAAPLLPRSPISHT